MQRTGMIVVDPRGTVQESYKTERRFYTHTRYKDVKKKFVLLKGKVLKAYFFLKLAFKFGCHHAS